MSNNKLTVFQKLTNVFTKDGVRVPKKEVNKYTIGNTEILRTNSKQEYDTAKLEAQQGKHLSRQWAKIDGELFQQAIHYETTRVGSYSDFENMEFYPEISAALDIMMEEATTSNNHGKVLNIYSDSSRVKTILEDLFFNRLDIHTNLPMWTRNTCKYGDNFVHLNIDGPNGIIGVRQLPNFEIERRDFDFFGNIGVINPDDDTNKTKFLWKGKDLVFTSWQVAHFRLLGDDRKLPYGTSVLEKARLIWKQLRLSEDAMLIYRVTRAPERRVYKIFVGNIDNEDVEAYINEIANRFKRTPLIDPQTGQMDLRYNQMGYDQDIFIPTRKEDASTPIDTLPGAQNLDQIADIEYLQRKLFTALRVPKSFLGFEEAAGEGKNLALQDIRFSRTVNRIQQSMIQEMNKIAIIHLFLLGFEDDLDNFTITLNNPSTQAEILKIEHMGNKFDVYKSAVADAGNGFGIMSMTRAKREILGWSDDEIKQDLLEQRMEKAAAAELENTANVIKNTGFFDKVDKIYGDMDAAKEGGADAEDDNTDGGPSGGGGGFGGGGFGDDALDFEEEDTDTDAEDINADAEEMDGIDFGDSEADTEGDTADTAGDDTKVTGEGLKIGNSLITENFKATKKPNRNSRDGDYLKNLMKSLDGTSPSAINNDSIVSKNIKINEGINKLLDDMDLNTLDE